MANLFPLVRPATTGSVQNLAESDTLLAGLIDRSTAGNLQIGTATATTVTLGRVGAVVDINSASITIDSAAAFSIDGAAASNLSVTSGNLTLSTITAGTLFITSAALLDIDAAANIDIDVTGTFDVLATSTFSIDGTGASNLSATSGNLTISTITAGVLYLTSAGLLTLTDGYKAASTYAIGFVLSDAAAEWDTFETNFGEVSLLNAMNQCGVKTLDDAYNNYGGGGDVYVDAGTINWSLTNSSFFTISLDGDPTYVGFKVLDGTDQFYLYHSAENTMYLDADLHTMNIACASTLSIDGVGASNLSITSGDLTISTITSGVLYLTSAGLLTLTDGYKAASGYSTDLVLSDSAAEWNTFETNFGEVSLLNAISQCGPATAGWVAAINTDVDTGTETIDSFSIPWGSLTQGSCFWTFFAYRRAGGGAAGTISVSWHENTYCYSVIYNDISMTQPIFTITQTDAGDTQTLELKATVTNDNWVVQVRRSPYMWGEIVDI